MPQTPFSKIHEVSFREIGQSNFERFVTLKDALLEFEWVFKKKITRSNIYNALITLMDYPGISGGQREIVLNALEKYLKGTADFGDCIILAEGEKYNCHRLKTLDKALLD